MMQCQPRMNKPRIVELGRYHFTRHLSLSGTTRIGQWGCINLFSFSFKLWLAAGKWKFTSLNSPPEQLVELLFYFLKTTPWNFTIRCFFFSFPNHCPSHSQVWLLAFAGQITNHQPKLTTSKIMRPIGHLKPIDFLITVINHNDKRNYQYQCMMIIIVILNIWVTIVINHQLPYRKVTWPNVYTHKMSRCELSLLLPPLTI